MKKTLIMFIVVLIGIACSLHAFAEAGASPSVSESLKKDFPKLQFQGIHQTEVNGLYEITAGSNVLYYAPKSGVILFAEMFSPDWRNLTAERRSRMLAESMKNVSFESAQSRSGIDGLVEILKDQTVLYVDPKSGTRLLGEMYTKDGTNLTAESRDNAVIRAALKDLPLDKAIKLGKGPKKVIMFTDPDCPFCRRIEDFFRERKDVTRYIYLLPLEQLHPQAMDKSKKIMCSKDRSRSFQDAMAGKLDNSESKPCEDRKVEAQLNDVKKLAEKLGIQGTPFLIVNNNAVRGADIKKIESLLAD